MKYRRLAQAGVSLLDTVCALAIVGSMSAVAMPHFADLPSEARVAVVHSLRGAAESASDLMHAKCLTQGACNPDSGHAVLQAGGSDVVMVRGYPQGGDPAGIVNAMRLSGFTVAHTGDATVFQKDGAPNMASCAVRYQSPQMDGALPAITTDTSGC